MSAGTAPPPMNLVLGSILMSATLTNPFTSPSCPRTHTPAPRTVLGEWLFPHAFPLPRSLSISIPIPSPPQPIPSPPHPIPVPISLSQTAHPCARRNTESAEGAEGQGRAARPCQSPCFSLKALLFLSALVSHWAPARTSAKLKGIQAPVCAAQPCLKGQGREAAWEEVSNLK